MPVAQAPGDAGDHARGGRRIVRPLALVGVLAAIAIVAATGLVTGPAGPRGDASGPPGASAAAPGAQDASPAVPGASAAAPPRTVADGLIAVVDANGALTTMDERGGSVVSYAVPGVVFGFPTWSPDGSRIAAVGTTAVDTSIYVFTVRPGDPGGGTRPVVIYRSPNRPRSTSTGRRTADRSPSSRRSRPRSRCGSRRPTARRPSTGAGRVPSSAAARRSTSIGRARIGCSCTSGPDRARSSARSAWTARRSGRPWPGRATSAPRARATTAGTSPTCGRRRRRRARSSWRPVTAPASTERRSSARSPSSSIQPATRSP